MFDNLWGNMLEFMSHGQNIAFSILAVIMISSAVFMISFTRIAHMVISMATVFLSMGAMFILLQAEFVAFVQVLIYAGSISILMIFGIMMTRHLHEEEEGVVRPAHNVLLFVGALAFFGIIFYAIQDTTFPPSTGTLERAMSTTMAIGETLYTSYVIPFELISVLLTVAFIGAIVIAKREEE
jgi:NADH-quinone oxidoreductase subunit J